MSELTDERKIITKEQWARGRNSQSWSSLEDAPKHTVETYNAMESKIMKMEARIKELEAYRPQCYGRPTRCADCLVENCHCRLKWCKALDEAKQ